MTYITAEEYASYTGTDMSADVFALAEARARKTVDYYTFNRIENPDDYGADLKRLMCELINLDKDIYTGGAVKSWSNDGVSVSFGDRTFTEEEYAGNKRQLIMEYLPRSLFYRGVKEVTEE